MPAFFVYFSLFQVGYLWPAFTLLKPLEVKMCEHRYRCFVCGEPQALDPEEPCGSCQEAEEELEQYILSQHDAEIAWGELTAAERNQVHLRETN